MGKKIKKSTAKFKKDHLSRVIAERRFDKKRKRKDLERDQKREAHQEQEKEQQQVAQEIEEDVQKAAPKSLGDLSVDEFMSGKFFDDDTEDDDVEIKQDQEDDDENEDDEANLDDEISSHKQTLSQLETLDPEFYKFMQENSSDLLNFEDDSDEEVVEEEKTAPPTKKDTKSDKKQKQKDKDETIENVYDSSFKVLTPSTLKFLQDQTVQGSVRALKRLCKIFRAACHLGDEDDKKNQSSQSSDEIRVTNSTLFNDVMRFAFRHMGIVFRTHFKFTSSTDTNKLITTHPRWDILGPVLKSFLGNCVHFLNQLVEPKMIRFVLTHFESLIPLFEPFPKFINKILKHLLRIWSSSDQNTRIDAFLRIRQMVIELPLKTGIVDMAMKGLYLTYVRNSKFTSPQSIPVIEFCANCVVELYGVETVSSYQHAFVYIRQLAIHLRNAIVNKTKDSYKTVYNWQYINCLRVWSRVLGTHGSSSSAPLHPLVYPFVQICLGVITLLPVTRYFPLRFQVIRFLNQLAEQTHIYIPIASHLIMVLQAAELHKKPGKSTRKAISLNDTLKVSKHVVTTKDFQESIVTTMLELLTTYFTIYSYSIAFPELIVPVKVMLKKYAKSTKIPRMRKQITQVIEKLETNATFITNKRATVNFAPKDMHTKALSGLSSFVPTEENPSASQLSPLARMAALQKKSPQNVVSSSDADWDGSIQKKAEDESKRRKQAGKDSDDEDDDEQDQEMDGEQEEDEDDDEDEDEDEDEDKDSSRRRKKAKTAAPAKSSAKAQSTPARPTKRQQQHQKQDGSDTEDQVQTFVMSDSDDE